MIYCTTGRCGANIDVNDSYGTIFVQCARGRGMQSGSNDRFYAEELCDCCSLASEPQYPTSYEDEWYDEDECDNDDDDGDITCFE